MFWKRRERDAARAEKDREIQRTCEATQKHQDSVNIATALHQLLDHLRIQDQQKRKIKDSFREWLTFGVALAAAVFACTQWLSMKAQQKTMQDQLNEMQEESRAWVSPKGNPAIFEPLSSDSNGIRVPLSVVLKNSGKNPASPTFVSAAVSVSQQPNEAWQRSVCDNPVNVIGASVFPGDEVSVGTVLYIATDQVAQITKSIPNGAASISPFIAACIIYKDAVTGKLHHTPYAFQLQMKFARPPRGCCAIFLNDISNLKEDDVALLVWPISYVRPD
jgi:hypothetical protein